MESSSGPYGPTQKGSGPPPGAYGPTMLGRYHVLAVLGRGAMGEVVEVYDAQSGTNYALKRLPEELAVNSQLLHEIRANFNLVSQLTHPHICTTRFLEQDPKSRELYLIMDLIRGSDLSKWLMEARERLGDRNGGLAVDLVLGIFEQIAVALDYAHSHPVSYYPDGRPRRYGILHRDLKPSNVMVVSGREFRPGIPYVKLVDFGLAAEIQASLLSHSQQSQRNALAGTPIYMAPEQWQGRTLTRGVDQWALAVMMYEMLAGRRPFQAPTEHALIHQIAQANPEPAPSLTPAQWAALKKTFNPDRKLRHPSCLALVRALADADSRTIGKIVSPDQHLPEEDDEPRPSSANQPAVKPPAAKGTAQVQAAKPKPRNTTSTVLTILGVATFLFLVVCGVAVFGFYSYIKSKPPAQDKVAKADTHDDPSDPLYPVYHPTINIPPPIPPEALEPIKGLDLKELEKAQELLKNIPGKPPELPADALKPFDPTVPTATETPDPKPARNIRPVEPDEYVMPAPATAVLREYPLAVGKILAKDSPLGQFTGHFTVQQQADIQKRASLPFTAEVIEYLAELGKEVKEGEPMVRLRRIPEPGVFYVEPCPLRVIKKIQLPDGPLAGLLAMDSNSHRVFVGSHGDQQEGRIWVLDTQSLEAPVLVTAEKLPAGYHDLLYLKSNKLAFANQQDASVTTINLEDKTIETLPVQGSPTSLANWTDDSFVVTSQGVDMLFIEGPKDVKAIKLNGVAGSVATRVIGPEDQKLLVSLTPNHITASYDTHVYEGNPLKKVEEIKGYIGMHGSSLTTAMVALPHKRKGFCVLDNEPRQETAHFAADVDTFVAVDMNALLGHAYGLVSGDPSILVVGSPYTGKEIQRVTLGKHACAMAYNENDGRVYVLNYDDRTITVLAGETISPELRKELDARFKIKKP